MPEKGAFNKVGFSGEEALANFVAHCAAKCCAGRPFIEMNTIAVVNPSEVSPLLPVASFDELLQRQLEVLLRQCGQVGRAFAVTEQADLKDDLGLDSLDLVELVVVVEQHWKIDLPDEEIGKWQRVGDVLASVRQHVQPAGH